MTPQERQLVTDLFDRLARLEDSPRDPEASRLILEGLRRAPNATYALVQTVLLQDEALRQAHERIEALEGGAHEAPQQGGFLDSMRDALFGGGERRGSVPNVPPPGGARPAWNTGQALPQAGYQPGGAPQGYAQGGFGRGPFGGGAGGGGSFLGTAAAAAAGMVGGSLLLNSFRSMMGGGSGGSHQSLADASSSGGDRSPWGSGGGSDNSLAQQAGLNDIGSSRGGGDEQRSSFFDQASNESSESFGGNEDFGDFDDGGFSDSEDV